MRKIYRRSDKSYGKRRTFNIGGQKSENGTKLKLRLGKRRD